MKRVVIIGAGYGGLRLYEKLADNGRFEVLLFDRHPYHYMQTEVYKYIANKTRFTDVTIDLHTLECSYGEKAVFYHESVTGVDFVHKRVVTEQRRVSYDYMVLSTGAVTNFALPIEGLRDHSHDLKTLQGAMRFKQSFESALLERIETEGGHCCFSVVVIGAGLSGVEIAAEMAHFASTLYRKNHFLCDRIRITLVSSAPGVLPGSDPYLGHISHKRLGDLGIEVLTERRAVRVEASRVILDNGDIIDSTFTLYAGGIMPSPLHARLDVAKDEKGFVLVDDTLRIKGAEGAFALGDCAHISDASGRRLPATADIAETSADLVADNILRLDAGQALRGHRLRSRGTLVALGGGYSAAKVGPCRFSGFLAFILKWAVERAYTFRLRRSCKAGRAQICQNFPEKREDM